jgi:hypothetical protein
MRPPKPLTFATLFLLLIQTVGCYSYQPLERKLPSRWEPGLDTPIVRVTLTYGEDLMLTRVSVDSTHIRGELLNSGPPGRRESIGIPLETVQAIKRRSFDYGRSALLIGGVLLVAAGGVAIAIGQALSQGGWSYE